VILNRNDKTVWNVPQSGRRFAERRLTGSNGSLWNINTSIDIEA